MSTVCSALQVYGGSFPNFNLEGITFSDFKVQVRLNRVITHLRNNEDY